MTTDLILGTAGHIDHGKTSLILALTGVNTDRLPEEKRRGITIELGFAELTVGDYRLGIVDVPGHEKFVRNMLAGATGMDIAMLIVAADDSIKQQTREHLDILRLLDLPAGVIVISKCDLVEPDWIRLVEDEVRELVGGTFLANAPIVRTSVTTGVGLEELRSQLQVAASQAAQSSRMDQLSAPFRMPIDRTFTMAGHGTVVTGSVSSGRVRIDDELVIEPGGVRVRVRGLQNHDRAVDEVHRGQRAAINLAGVHHDETQRGQELASIGHLVPSKLISVHLTILPTTPRPLKNRDRVRIHVGTAEVMATVRLLNGEQALPGEQCLAQLYLGEPCVTTWHQPFVVRSESPVHTIGGGRVLDPNAERIRRLDSEIEAQLGRLSSRQPLDRAGAALYFAGWRGWKPEDVSRTAGIEDTSAIAQELLASGECREIRVSPTRTVRVHQLHLSKLCDRIASVLKRLHESNPLALGIDRSQIIHAFDYLEDEEILNVALESMKQAQRVQISLNRTSGLADRLSPAADRITLAGHGPKLSNNEQKLLVQLVELHRQAGLQPPTVKECREKAARLQDSVPQLLALAVANGDLVAVCSDFYLHAEADRAARERIRERLTSPAGLPVSEIREILNTSRKYAVPYCEYLDRTGFTERRGDVRVLSSKLEARTPSKENATP